MPPAPPPARIDNPASARAMFAPLGAEPHEVTAFAYIDRDRRVLGLRHTRSGAVDRIDVPIRAVAADALAFGAAGVVMAHNHPSGDATPSDADLALTTRLARTLEALDVRLVDHLIVTRFAVTSLRTQGLF